MAEGGQDLKFDFDFMKILLKTGIRNCWPRFTNLIVDISNGEFTWKKIYQTSDSHTESQMLYDKEFKAKFKVQKEKADKITDKAEKVDKTEVVDKVEKVGKAEKVDKTEKDDKTEKVDKAETVDKIERVDKTEKVDIILTSNYSPCWECAVKLIDFYEEKKSLIRNFTIRFSRIYRKDEEENKDGLKDLNSVGNSAGITLEAMTEKSWFNVLMTDKSWLDSMSTHEKSSFEKIMNEKDWFDKVMEQFGLVPNEVKERDAATSKHLTDLLAQDKKTQDSRHKTQGNHQR